MPSAAPTAISLCSGIGGLDLAVDMAGIHVTHMIEWNAFCCDVLRARFPNSTVIHGSIEDERDLPYADVIFGGIPCQPYSAAGKREGFADERNLWPAAFRIIRQLQPRAVLVENVFGSVTGSDNLTDYILNDLETLGYTGAAFVIPALVFGAPHERYRVFTVAYTERNGLYRPEAGNTARNPKRQYPSYQQRRAAVFHEAVSGGQVPRKHQQPGKSRVVRAAHGTARRLDFPGFPAGQGTYQYPYEPPRTVETKAPFHRERVQALGNAVVWQQAYPLAQAIHDWLVSTTYAREPMEDMHHV